MITIDMKLRVQQKDGRVETIDIAQPVSILEGVELHRIVGSDGMEHFFTKEGYYDGWGTGCPLCEASRAIIDAIESQRKKKS
jgi:hypothetical protein